MELAELIKRVEGLTGPNPDFDVSILRHLAGGPDANVIYAPITASVDAVIQLIGEMSSWRWELLGGGGDPAYARIEGGHGDTWIELADAECPTPALALLLAFLRAWEARGEKA